MKKLYRSKSDKKLAGVCGGLSQYLDVDATIIRLVCAASCLFGGAGLWIYIIAWIVMPEEPVKPAENVVDEQ